MRFIAIFALILLMISPASSAVIYGDVYSWELKKVKAVVEINTTPIQRIVAENGSYEFNVPIGTYEITAYSDGLFCKEIVVVKEEGTYRLDLILFPNLNQKINWTEPNFSIETENTNPALILIPILVAIAPIFYFLWLRRKRKRFEEDKESLPEDLALLLSTLKSLGGRASQKELREKIGWSEAKLSLALTDLERRGLIEKYKKGRGNIIFLKEK